MKYFYRLSCFLLIFAITSIQSESYFDYFDGNNPKSIIRRFPFLCEVAKDTINIYLTYLKYKKFIEFYTYDVMKKNDSLSQIDLANILEDAQQRRRLLYQARVFALLPPLYNCMIGSIYYQFNTNTNIKECWSQLKYKYFMTHMIYTTKPFMPLLKDINSTFFTFIMNGINEKYPNTFVTDLPSSEAPIGSPVLLMAFNVIISLTQDGFVRKIATNYSHKSVWVKLVAFGALACISNTIKGNNNWVNHCSYQISNWMNKKFKRISNY